MDNSQPRNIERVRIDPDDDGVSITWELGEPVAKQAEYSYNYVVVVNHSQRFGVKWTIPWGAPTGYLFQDEPPRQHNIGGSLLTVGEAAVTARFSGVHVDFTGVRHLQAWVEADGTDLNTTGNVEVTIPEK